MEAEIFPVLCMMKDFFFNPNLGHLGFCFVRPWILFNLFIFWQEATLFTIYMKSEGLVGMKAQFTIL